MSGKLDQSLDEIVSSHRRGAPRSRGRRVHTTRQGAKPVAAPIGGVKKTTRPVKGGTKSVPTGPSGGLGESKILVSNLPRDVNEQQIKEYFGSTVGPIKRVEISYGPNGVSKGNATIVFVRPDSATKAIKVANGVHIDNKPIKVDVILDAVRAAAIPPPKGLSERVTAPKPQPKSAATTKSTGTTSTRGGKGKPRGNRRNGGRPAKKTAEQLDSEMADYWQTGAAAPEGSATASGAAPAANGDAPMEDEIM